ncbi:hypothetical protein [Flavobacterium sp. GP15]|uniref:hypothetical protein n=1 Tax=Flavobacterium sp. GP15 TaxID=2758567 RepID=UPI00165E538E|nr:hypothetical protein [Flavobacterium sp. GP15]
MIKKLLLLSVIVSQLAVSCTNNDETEITTDATLQEQIADIVKQPYSKLTPAEQKIKLEVEANEMLNQLEKSKTSGAIEAMENLERLLQIDAIDVFGGKNNNKIEDILNTADVYGIYTWNNTNKIWVKTTSKTELQFIFPAKKSQNANNAVFSCKSVASNVKIQIVDTYGNGYYDNATGIYIQIPDVKDSFFLPTSADAVLTIDKVEAATFAQTAKYSTKNESPDDFSYKMTLNDGYAWEINAKKATENTTRASFTYNKKNLIEFNAGSTANIDALLDNDEITSYRGKANGLIKIMENFIIVADMDLATMTTDEAALNKTLIKPNYNSSTYYSEISAYNKALAEGNVNLSNKNIKLILVSKKDGTKIADVIQRSVKGYSFINYSQWVTDKNNSNGGYWSWNSNNSNGTLVQDYDQVYNLKFGDQTEVEMSAYFSAGFEKFEAKFEDFIKAFDRK